MDCIVVKVVARERTEGAGDEKVLSPPLRNSIPPFAVRLVPVRDEAPCDGAVDLEVSFSVDIVGAMDLPPAVGGARRSPSSIDERAELSRAREVALVLVLLAVEAEYRPCSSGSLMPILPDWGYGLFFFDCFDFGVVLTWLRFEVVCLVPSLEDTALKLASFFIKLEKGRRRPGRSNDALLASFKGPVDGLEKRLLRTGTATIIYPYLDMCRSGNSKTEKEGDVTMRRLRRGLGNDGRGMHSASGPRTRATRMYDWGHVIIES
jgi:hypothetical protein